VVGDAHGPFGGDTAIKYGIKSGVVQGYQGLVDWRSYVTHVNVPNKGPASKLG
jgi:hypothetical protein